MTYNFSPLSHILYQFITWNYSIKKICSRKFWMLIDRNKQTNNNTKSSADDNRLPNPNHVVLPETFSTHMIPLFWLARVSSQQKHCETGFVVFNNASLFYRNKRENIQGEKKMLRIFICFHFLYIFITEHDDHITQRKIVVLYTRPRIRIYLFMFWLPNLP